MLASQRACLFVCLCVGSCFVGLLVCLYVRSFVIVLACLFACLLACLHVVGFVRSVACLCVCLFARSRVCLFWGVCLVCVLVLLFAIAFAC